MSGKVWAIVDWFCFVGKRTGSHIGSVMSLEFTRRSLRVLWFGADTGPPEGV